MKDNLLKGSLFAILGFFCMAVFGILSKIASENGTLWISVAIYTVSTLLLIPWIIPLGLRSLKTEHFLYHFGRALFGVSASFLYMISMQYIPIVNATLLFNTAPIFIPIISIVWLKMHVPLKIWLAIILGFIGIIIIIQPTLEIFTQAGALIGLASGVCLAVAYLLIKLLTPTDPSFRIIFYFFFLATCIQLPFLLFAGPLPDVHNFLLAAVAGLMFVLAQMSLVEAYRNASASAVGVYQYTSVVFVGILEWLIWNQIPKMIDLLGMILVVLAGIIIIRSNSKS